MTRAYISATLPASGSVPEEGNMPDDQPVAGGDADAVFRSLYAAHGPAFLGREVAQRAHAGVQEKARIPVCARPRIKAWIS